MTGKKMTLDRGMDIDDSALSNDYVSVTPIHYDLTNYDFLKEMEKWTLKP